MAATKHRYYSAEICLLLRSSFLGIAGSRWRETGHVNYCYLYIKRATGIIQISRSQCWPKLLLDVNSVKFHLTSLKKGRKKQETVILYNNICGIIIMFESFVINKILYISIFGNNRASLELTTLWIFSNWRSFLIN